MGKKRAFYSTSISAVPSDWQLVSPSLSSTTSNREPFRKGRMIRSWPRPYPCFTYTKIPKLFQDRPDTDDCNLVVSDRLRLLLDSLASGDLQFLPINITGPKSDELAQYWLVNWLTVCDCLDRPKSLRKDRIGVYVEVPVIDTSRIEQHVKMALVKDYEVMDIVAESVVREINQHGITGFRFNKL
jgi:hypothetical protein